MDFVSGMGAVEGWSNNAYQRGNKATPFFANYGRHPLTASHPNFKPHVETGNLKNPRDVILRQIRDAMSISQDCMSAFTDQHRRDHMYKPGDYVLLKQTAFGSIQPEYLSKA